MLKSKLVNEKYLTKIDAISDKAVLLPTREPIQMKTGFINNIKCILSPSFSNI